MVPPENWRIRIDRAKFLVTKYPESANLLEFYIEVTELQADISANMGNLAAFLPRLRALPVPEPLRKFPVNEELLGPEPASPEGRFFWRILHQPFAESSRKPAEPGGSECPSCGSKPVAGVLRGEGDGAKRALMCSFCALEWPYRRLICAHCGEEDKEKLPVYLAAQIPHVRVEACDTCHTYLKSVDLTKDGFAVPQVDEIATVVLNLWAEEHGYSKIETNLLGM